MKRNSFVYFVKNVLLHKNYLINKNLIVATLMGNKPLTYHLRIHLLNLIVTIRSWLLLSPFMQILRALLFHVKFNTKLKLRALHMKLRNIKYVVTDVKFSVNVITNIQKESRFLEEKMLLSNLLRQFLKNKCFN